MRDLLKVSPNDDDEETREVTPIGVAPNLIDTIRFGKLIRQVKQRKTPAANAWQVKIVHNHLLERTEY